MRATASCERLKNFVRTSLNADFPQRDPNAPGPGLWRSNRYWLRTREFPFRVSVDLVRLAATHEPNRVPKSYKTSCNGDVLRCVFERYQRIFSSYLSQSANYFLSRAGNLFQSGSGQHLPQMPRDELGHLEHT